MAGCDGCGEDRESVEPGPRAGPLLGVGPVADATPRDARVARIARIDRALARGAQYLVGLQDQDGSFRSVNYAAFRDGYSLSPQVLLALWFVQSSDIPAVTPALDRGGAAPEAEQNRDLQLAKAYQRGVDFVASLVQSDGSLRAGLDGPSYPYYAITGALLVLNTPGNERHEQAREALIEHIRARQLTEARGFEPSDPSYGGWGYSPGIPQRPAAGDGSDPRVAGNLSATLFSLGAIRLAGVPADDPAMQRALQFVMRCQNWRDADAGEPARPADRGSSASAEPAFDDGGFFFSPVIPDSNKAGAAGEDRSGQTRYRSYGSMTADGLRALLRLGLPPEHPRVQSATAWLLSNFDPAQNPGSFPAEAEVRRASSYYYYVWSSAHALRTVGATTVTTADGPIHWAEALAEVLLERQREDGSWSNPYTELREDDPLIATPFAIAGLATARMALGRMYRSHGYIDSP
ncbi:MAG: hypothetical protein Tsb0020_07690 [Haliangiales bacterium]